MKDHVFEAMMIAFVIAISVMIGGFAYSGAIQRERAETVCRTQMLQANRSTEDILKVCLRK